MEERVPLEVFEAIQGIIKDLEHRQITKARVVAQLTMGPNMDIGVKVMGLSDVDFAYICFLLKGPPGESFTIG